MDGLVLRVSPADRTMLVSHRDIPGYMRAMVMPFRVQKSSELDGLAPGARVRFQLVVGKRAAVARRIRKQSGSADLDVRIPEPAERIGIGSVMPDFTLTDQNGCAVRLADFRGKVVAVNFIYTRCPLPEVCPRLSATFAQLQRRFAKSMGSGLALLSISIDPQYDTPDVLAAYARKWGADAARWRFLTGALGDVRQVAARFGLVFWPEEGLLTHTSQTGVIARDGTLVAIVEGSSYSATQLGDLIQLQLEGHP